MVPTARSNTRQFLAAATALLLVLFWVPGLAGSLTARADSGSTIPNSPYNGGDGTIPDSNASIHHATDPTGNSDTTSFTGGKEDDQCPGISTQGLSSPKDDLTDVWFGSQTVSSNVFLYLAWQRSTTQGTTTIDFELNQANGFMPSCNGVNPERTAGDLLFTYDFSNGGGNVDINYYVWDTTLNNGDGGWKAKGDITSLLDSNNKPIVEAATDSTGAEGELAVNLTLLPGVFTADTCKDFGTAWAKTRSSTAFDSEIKDYVTPQSAVISNCAPLEILKEDSGTNPLADASFSIVANSGTHAVPAGQSPCTTQTDGYCRVEIPNTSPQAYASPLLFPGNYHVTETTAPPGYLLPATTGFDVTVPQTVDAKGNVVPLTVHNDLGSLTFSKVDAQSTNTPVGGASFLVQRVSGDGTQSDVSVTDKTPSSAGSNDDSSDAGTMTVSGLKTGTYSITETTPLPAGYGKDTSTIYITIDQTDQSGFLSDSKGKAISGTATFEDPRLPVNLRVIKTDGGACDPDATTPSSHCLAGAEFGLYQLRSGAGVTPDISKDSLVDTCVTQSNGACSLQVAHWGGQYYWYENSAPAGYNLPADRYSGVIDLTSYPANGVVPATTFADTRPTITTSASDAVVGAAISDSATLNTVAPHAGGSISFSVYGPFAAAADITSASCTPSELKTTLTNSTVDGAGAYGSGDYVPTATGYYAWIASYSGDAATGTAAVSGVCADTDETSQVSEKQPTIATTAQDAHTVTGTMSDSAQLSDFFGTPTGTVTFSLYKDCNASAIGSVTVAIHSDGTASSTDTPVSGPTGTFAADGSQDSYFWAASYDGTNDPNNLSVSEGCDPSHASEISHTPLMATPVKSPASGVVSVDGPNNTITYTITAQNTGLASANGVVITEPASGVGADPTVNVFAKATYINGSAACGTGTSAGCPASITVQNGVISWTTNIAAGGSASVSFSVTVNPADGNGDHIFNQAAVTSGSSTLLTNVTNHVVQYPSVYVTKASDPVSGTSSAPAPVTPGQVITYTLTVHNDGLADASGVPVSDVVPTGTTYVDGSADATGGVFDGGIDTVTWSVSVAAGQSAQVQFQAQVDGNDTNGTLIDNTASFPNVHSPSNSCVNPSATSCSTNTTFHEVEFAVLALAKTADPASGSIVQRGDNIAYTIAVTNSGLADAQGITVSDTLPHNVTFIDTSANPAPATNSGGVVTWVVDVPAAANGTPGVTTITYSVTVDSDAPEGSTLTNAVLIAGTCPGAAGGTDPCTTDHHVPTGALTLVKHVDKTTANFGDTLTYTFDAATTGQLDQHAVVVNDVVPQGTTYVDGSAACTDTGPCTATYDAASTTVSWQLGDMSAGAVRHLVFKVSIARPTAAGNGAIPATTIDNVGAVLSTETATTPSNHVITQVVAVLGEKVVRKLPFTGLPVQDDMVVALTLIALGVALTAVRRSHD